MAEFRYVIEEADTALPWQHFYRIYDTRGQRVMVEGDDRAALKEIVDALNRGGNDLPPSWGQAAGLVP